MLLLDEAERDLSAQTGRGKKEQVNVEACIRCMNHGHECIALPPGTKGTAWTQCVKARSACTLGKREHSADEGSADGRDKKPAKVVEDVAQKSINHQGQLLKCSS